jgi:pentatricopeptide repeat protein
MSISFSIMWEQSVQGFAAVQTEIAIFAIALLTHTAFRGLRFSRKKATLASKAKCVDSAGLEELKNDSRKSRHIASCDMANFDSPGASYNAILRANLQKGAFKEARQVLDEMRQRSLHPSRTILNELVDAAMKSSVDEAWSMIDEMHASGVKPDRITCSILLKSIQKNCSAESVTRILSLLDDMDGEADDVFLNSFIEACIRIGRSDLLTAHLRKQRSSKKLLLKTPHAYASLIRACGYAGDIAGVWETWRDMRKNHVTPTSITLGCIVEALISNGQTDASYELLQESLSDLACKPLVNSVIYGSVLKGFSHQKRFDRVWMLYEEMLDRGIEFSIITFNTILDACARSGDIGRITTILESMTGQGIQPNLITYGIVIKGYCQENRLEEALQVWESMISSTDLKPDEIMYNTILDGCARKGLYKRGMALLAEMQASGIRPTNFTLSVLVKLASRANLLDRAFEICEELSAKYKFRINIHVFNNLIQGCATHNQLERAFDVLDQLVCERVRPDARTYTLLIKACTAAREGRQAVGLIRAAFGLRDVHPRLASCATSACQIQKGLPQDVVVEALEGISGQCHENALALALFKDLKCVPNLRLPAHLQLRLANKAIKR